ncbi:leucine-rich repeat protein, partial [Streptococcus salivarius]|uniref:leucine-rich repeat protein n=1 Tax=Streptococcus salivarius TaxID=1304 RepID=UPI00191472B9
MKEVLKLRKRRTGQWVTVAGMVLIGACMTIGNTVVFADDTQTYPIEASDSNKFNLTDSPSPLSSENLGTNNRGHEVATLPSTGQVDSSAKTTPEYLMSESSTVSLVTSDVATTETSTSVLASLSEVVPTKSTDSSETLAPSTLSEASKHASTSEGAVAEVKIQSETLVEHSTNSNREEESGDNLIYDIHNQEVTITDIKRKETIKKLIIPQRISNYRVTEIGANAFSGSSLKEVVLPSTLKKIGSEAFRNTQLTSITLPEGLTEIGSYAFSDSSLKEVVLPSTLTKIGYNAFLDTKITELYIPDSVTNLDPSSFGFSGNYSNVLPPLTKVSLPSRLQSTGSPFSGQESLKEVVFRGNWKTIPSGLFSGIGIEKLVIPEGVTEIGSNAFLGSSLKEVVLPSTLKKIDSGAFRQTQLTSITLPEGVTEIGSNAFSGSSLKEVVLPSTLTKIGNSAFSWTELTNMLVPSSVREIGSYAFANTPLEVINLPNGLQIIGYKAFQYTKLETIEIPEGVTYLYGGALADISTLKSVYLPKSLTTFVQSGDTPSEGVEYHVYLDSFALEYMIEKQLNFKLRDENVANDDSKVLDSSNSYYLTTTTGTRRQGYLGLDLKYAIKKDKSSDDGKYVLHLNIPSTTKVFESKIRVNGQDVTATVSNGYLDIPVSEEVGKIKLMLMTENRELTNVRLFAQLSYQKDRKKVSENIGAINVNIPVLTLTANQVTSRSYSRISGVADPNDQVIAYLDDMVVGQVKIKKDGSYTFDIPLVTPVDNKEYTIKVKALSSDGREISETTTVRYEKNYPELVNFIMRHNGYTYNLKENQDKVPVISFRPGGQFDFEVEYSNTSGNDSLYLVSSREGINKVIELKWDVKKEKYVYTGYFDQENTSYIPGKMSLYLEKGVAPSETIYSREVQDNLSQRTADKILKIDSDGDGYPDIVDKHPNAWDVGDRDLAIFSLLSYKSEEEIKKIFLAKSFKDKGLKIGGLDQALFENWRLLGSPVFLPGVANINVYRFVNDKTKEIVLAIRGTDQEVRNGGNMGIEKPYLSPEWIDNYFNIWRGISKDKEVIKKSLNLLLPSGSDYDVSIVGHSRGSYLAYILAAEMLKNRLIAQDYEKIDSVIDTKKLIRGNLKNVVTFNGVGLAAEKEQMLAGVKGLIERLIQNAIGGGILGSPLQRIIDELSTTDFQSEKELIELLQSSGLTRAYSIIGDPVSDPFRNGIGIGVHPNIVLPRYEKKQLINPENGELSEHDIHNFLYYLSQGVRNSKNQFRGIGDLKSNEINERISSSALSDFKFVIDPSGFVINDVSKNPITGAITTIYYRGENGEEVLWDAGEYSQFNPLFTTVNGEYAWDVPEGFWKVKVSKEGYESAESDWLPVPPPQTEVHFNLKPLSYKITYKVGDGILKEDVPRSYQTDVDTELPYPVRKGYVFTGWYLDDNFSGEPYFNTLFDKAGDKVLYAKWEKDTKILSDDDNVVTVTVSGNDVNVIGKVVKKEVTNADILEKVGDHNNLLMEIQALDDDGNIVSLSEDAKLDLEVISGRKPYKVLHYVKDKSTFEEVPFDWNEKDKNISLTTSTLGVYLIQSKLTEQQMTTKVRQESRVLKTDKIEYVDDASLDVGKVREIASVDGQVLVEITDIYVNGELQSSTEKELSRIEPQSKKVYRGTKQVSQVPDVAPIEHSKPEAIIETKVRQESRVLKTDKIEYVDDASLDVG